jgi:hypothetical protein
MQYLDEMEDIEQRWDVFYSRFKLMGAMNPEFVKQCKAFLEFRGLTEDEYRDLHKEVHQKMRNEARTELFECLRRGMPVLSVYAQRKSTAASRLRGQVTGGWRPLRSFRSALLSLPRPRPRRLFHRIGRCLRLRIEKLACP